VTTFLGNLTPDLPARGVQQTRGPAGNWFSRPLADCPSRRRPAAAV